MAVTPPDSRAASPAPATTVHTETPPHIRTEVSNFFTGLHASTTRALPETATGADFYSDLIRGILKVHHVSRGLVSCSFSVIPPVANYYRGLHGGAVAVVAERVAMACARTVLAEDKPLFLGELSLSYLSAAPLNAEVIVEGSVVRSGRSINVISVEFRLKNTPKLVYTALATFFSLPSPSKL